MRFLFQDSSLQDVSVHAAARGFPDVAAQHRAFMIWHVVGAALLLMAGGAGSAWAGWPGGLYGWTGLWLLSPLLAPLVLRITSNMYISQFISLISLSIVIAVVSLQSGSAAEAVSMNALVIPIVALLYRDQSLNLAGGLLGVVVVGGVALWGSGGMFFIQAALLLVITLVALFVEARLERIEWAAKKGEADLSFLTDQVADMLMRHGPDGEPVYVSPAVGSLLGRAPEDLVGRCLLNLAHGEDQTALENIIERAGFFGGEARLDYRLQHQDGHYVWVETRFKPVIALGASGLAPKPKNLPIPACFELVSVTRDISERKARERALRQEMEAAELATQSKSQFLANMSHELRTPLNAVIGFSEMIKEQTFGPIGVPKYLEYANLIFSSGHHLLGLINDVLDVSKIESGKYTLSLEMIDAVSIIRDSLSLVQVASQKAGVKLESALENGIPRFSADKRALKQILLNLLSNAVKFTPKGGVITIGASCDSEMFYLQVLDTGVGISEKDLARLGQPYEQVMDPFTRKKIGTGLGLTLISALAELHGGNVNIESILGSGTCVTVALPLRQSKDGAAHADLAVVIDNDTQAASDGVGCTHAVSQPDADSLKGAA